MRPSSQPPPAPQPLPSVAHRYEEATAAAPALVEAYQDYSQPVAELEQSVLSSCDSLGSRRHDHSGTNSQADSQEDNGSGSDAMGFANSASSRGRSSDSSRCHQAAELCNGDAASVNRHAAHPDQHRDMFRGVGSNGGQEGQQDGNIAGSVSKKAAHFDQQGHIMSESQDNILQGSLWDRPAIAGWDVDPGAGQADGGDEVLGAAMPSAEQQQQQQQQSCPPSANGSGTSAITSAGW